MQALIEIRRDAEDRGEGQERQVQVSLHLSRSEYHKSAGET
jgi:hypothetical protein